MSYEVIGITVLWIFLFGYLIVASIDFGAGFFSYYSTITGKRHLINNVIERYLSPVWEVTNVFLVFFFVGFVGFFPDTAYYYGTALLLPGSVAIILLAIRGSYYAFSNYGSKKDSRFYLFLYGASGLLIPASLSTVLTISEGGYIDVDDKNQVTFLFSKLFTSTYSWTVVLLALVSVLYISAMFLCYYANRANDRGAFEVVRKYAIAWSGPTILSSLLVFFAIRGHNAEHFLRMGDYAWMFILSFVVYSSNLSGMDAQTAGAGIYLRITAVWIRLLRLWARHLPYICIPYLTIYDNFTSEPMAIALISVFLLGLLLLIPSLYLLMRLFLFDANG